MGRNGLNFRQFIRKASITGLKGLHKIGDFFNTLFTSGSETDFGQTSPFSDMDRHEIQNGRRRFGRRVKRKIEDYSVFASPTSYYEAIKAGKIDPREGAKIIAKMPPEKQLLYAGIDLGTLSAAPAVPKAARSTKKWAWNVETRGIETAMRSGGAKNPLPLGPKVKAIGKQKGGLRRLFSIGKYIFTGRKTGKKGYYNSLSPDPENYYGGFVDKTNSKSVHFGNDLVDATLYGKTIEPAYGVKRVKKGKGFGMHSKHIRETYGDKVNDIQVYDIDTPNSVKASNVKDVSNPMGYPEQNELFGSNTAIVDASGHMERWGVDKRNGDPLVKAEDIWAFHPERYRKRWLPRAGFLVKRALRRIFKHTTPVVTRAKWQRDPRFVNPNQPTQ